VACLSLPGIGQSDSYLIGGVASSFHFQTTSREDASSISSA
jgi:hypothetical protein